MARPFTCPSKHTFACAVAVAVAFADVGSESGAEESAPGIATIDETGAVTREIPRYHVILWDDDDHTYEYVIEMLRELFGYTFTRAYEMAEEVDTRGKVIVATMPLEHAELKRDQIHAYGKDWRIPHCQGSMFATLERV